MLHDPLQSLQWAGCPNVSVSCHSWDSLLHCAVDWQTMSSELQLEHTGVVRAARALLCSPAVRGDASSMMSNGLISVPRRIPPPLTTPMSATQPTIVYNCDVDLQFASFRCAHENAPHVFCVVKWQFGHKPGCVSNVLSQSTTGELLRRYRHRRRVKFLLGLVPGIGPRQRAGAGIAEHELPRLGLLRLAQAAIEASAHWKCSRRSRCRCRRSK
jgi:hypothetical protein